jgi:hypothetical protein
MESEGRGDCRRATVYKSVYKAVYKRVYQRREEKKRKYIIPTT